MKLLNHLEHEDVEKLLKGGVSLSRKTGRGYGSYGVDENTYKGSCMVSFEVPIARVGAVQDGVVEREEISACNIRPTVAPDVETGGESLARKSGRGYSSRGGDEKTDKRSTVD